MSMESLITKKDTMWLKGIAVLILMYHHLFGTSERVG